MFIRKKKNKALKSVQFVLMEGPFGDVLDKRISTGRKHSYLTQ